MCDTNSRLHERLTEAEVALQFARAARWASSGRGHPITPAKSKPRTSNARRSKGWSSHESTMSGQTDGADETATPKHKRLPAESEDGDKSVVANVVVVSDASQT